MKTYNVYFTIGKINNFAELKGFEYKLVCASTGRLSNVFRSCQNDNPDFRLFNERSMCVGDIIQDSHTGDCYIVENYGFKKVPRSIIENVGSHLLFAN